MVTLSYPPPQSERRHFFMPPNVIGEMAIDAWQAVRSQLPFASTERKVQRIQYNNRRGVFTSEVNYLEHDDAAEWLTTGIYEPANIGEPWMIAIMRVVEGGPQWRDPPILVGASEVLYVTDFLPDTE